jgi:hypothetical protein
MLRTFYDALLALQSCAWEVPLNESTRSETCRSSQSSVGREIDLSGKHLADLTDLIRLPTSEVGSIPGIARIGRARFALALATPRIRP